MNEKKKTLKNKPDLLKVSLRIAIILIMCVGAFSLYKLSGANDISVISKIGIAVLLGVAGIVLLQLIVWGLKWVRHERVSELGLHIVRFAVTLTAVALCVFVLLSFDYANLYAVTEQNELRQHALAGRVYIQNAIGEDAEDTRDYYSRLAHAANSLLIKEDEQSDVYVCLYLRTEGANAAEAGFIDIGNGYMGVSTNPSIPCFADAELLENVLNKSVVEIRDDLKSGSYNIMAAYSPVYSTDGRPVGVLEICEIKHAGAEFLHFATLELCLKLLALIAFFAFAFYGCMQLVDIMLRPKQFDRSRRVLSCGRESARPVLFLVAISAALPVMMLMFADNMRSLADGLNIPFGIGTFLPLIVYIIGIAIGQMLAKRETAVISEVPADVGLVISFLCNLALCLFMDWKKLSGLGMSDNIFFMLLLVFVCGAGYGVAYRITAKFQAQADAMFGYDKYVYLSSCLGVMSGIVLGGIIIENYSNVTLRIVSCILTAFTAVMAIILLENLKSTVDTNEVYKDTLTSYAGGIVGIIPVGMACCYNWIYLTGYMFNNEISIAAIAFCAIAPIIAFCFGNRLRIRKRGLQKITLVISGIFAALAFLPMALQPGFNMAVLSCALVCLSVIFGGSAVYSITRHGELKKFTNKLLSLLPIGIAAAAVLLVPDRQNIGLFAVSAACAVFMIVSLISKFPSRPIIGNNLPAITDGKPEKDVPVVIVPPIVKKEDAEQTEDKEDKKKEKKRKEKKLPVPVVVNNTEEKEKEKAENNEEPASEPEKKREKKKDKKDKKAPVPIIVNDSEEKKDEKSEPESKEENKQDEPPAVIAPEVPEIKKEDKEETAKQPEEPQPQPEASEDAEEMSPEAMEAARAAAAQRAKEQWRKYNSGESEAASESKDKDSDNDMPIIFPD